MSSDNLTVGEMRRLIKEYQEQSKKLFPILLSNIKDMLEQVDQWAEIKSFEFAYKYQIQLEALVEVLEEFDCGSVGGFGQGQPPAESIEQRAKWLLAKYGPKVKK